MRDSLTLLLLSQGPFFRGGCNAKKPLRSGDLRAHLLAVNTTGGVSSRPKLPELRCVRRLDVYGDCHRSPVQVHNRLIANH